MPQRFLKHAEYHEPLGGKDDRPQMIVGRDAREHVRRHFLLQRRVPKHIENLPSEPGDDGGIRDKGHGQRYG